MSKLMSVEHFPDAPGRGDPAECMDEESGVTAQLCSWITSLSADDVPRDVLERGKHMILDGIVCGLVGAHVPWTEKAAEATLAYEPEGYCSLIGYEQGVGPLAAALLNSASIQAIELDDYHSIAPLHSASVVLPALFAAAQAKNWARGGGGGGDSAAVPLPHTSRDSQVSGLDFLLSAIVGFETGPRSGWAMYGGDLLQRGWHCGPVFGSPAAAAASAKLLGLSADDTESAIGIACTQAGGLMAAQYEGMIKRVQHGFAARNGLLGALMARDGYVGIKKVYERKYGGFLAMFSQGNGRSPPYDVRKVTEGLGEVWQTSKLKLKMHACVGGCHGQIEAIEKLQERYPERFGSGVDLGKTIKKITVGLSGPIFAHDGWPPHERPMNATGAQMNAAYIGAVQMVDGQVLVAQFANSALDRDEVWDLIYKTECYHETAFDRPNYGCGGRVVVEFEDGFEVEETVDMPRGFDPPITDAEIRNKYRKLAASAVGEERMQEIERIVLELENVEDISELIKLFPEPTRQVLDM